MNINPVILHDPYANYPQHIQMLCPVAALGLGLIAIGAIALAALRGGDVGIFHPLSSVGLQGAWGWGLVASGGVLVVASITLMINKARSISLVRQMARDMKKHAHNWGPIFDHMSAQGFFITGAKGKPKGSCCTWVDPKDPATQFICVVEGTERRVEVYYGNSTEDVATRVMDRLAVLSDRRVQLTSTPPMYRGINMETVKKTWSSDPTDEDMEHFDQCQEEILDSFLGFHEKSPDNSTFQEHKINYNGYVFTVKAKGEQRSLYVQKPNPSKDS